MAQLPADIVTLQDVSGKWKVVGTNFLLALLLALLFGTSKGALDNTMEARESAVAQKIARFRAWLNGLTSWDLAPLMRKALVYGLLPLVVIVYGLLFSVLDPDHSLFGEEALFLVLSLGLSLGLIELADDLSRWAWARRLRAPTSLALHPANMFFALFAAGSSRLLALVPGFIVGVPGGVRVDEHQLTNRQSLLLSVAGWFGVMVLALLGWFGAGLLAATLGDGGSILGISAPYAHDFLLILYLAGIEVMFFQLLPWSGSGGESLYRYNRLWWVVLFAAVSFVAWHTLFNPNGSLIDVFSRASVVAVLAVVGAFDVVLLLIWRFSPRSTPTEPDAINPAGTPAR
ncbi:MAG: hypothetical protein ACR2HN_05235 [Tepidiformaceae bacterium]